MKADRQEIVQYLLGELPEEASSRLEERYFEENEIHEEVRAAEIELLDAYAAGELTPRDREKVESLLSRSERWRNGLELTQALRRTASKTTARGSPTPAAQVLPGLPALGGARVAVPPVFWAAAAALLLAVAVLALWSAGAGRRLTRLESERAELLDRVKGLEGQLDGQRLAAERFMKELAEERRWRQSVEAERDRRPVQEPRSATLVLAARLLREPGPMERLVLQRDVEQVRLSLMLTTDQHVRYRAQVATPEGQVVFRAEARRSRPLGSGRGVVLELPARVLTAGDYLVALGGASPAGRYEDVADYAFRVVRPE